MGWNFKGSPKKIASCIIGKWKRYISYEMLSCLASHFPHDPIIENQRTKVPAMIGWKI